MAREKASAVRFSESVVAYYTDKKIANAVDLLLDDGLIFSPDRDDWDRVETYFAAWIAARQTQVDYVRDLFRLWCKVWNGIPKSWQTVAADPTDEELSLDPAIRWDEKYFERHFKLSHNLTVTLWVSFGDKDPLSRFEMAFDVRRGKRSILKGNSEKISEQLPDWTFENGAMRLASTRPYQDGVDLDMLVMKGPIALTAINEFEW